MTHLNETITIQIGSTANFIGSHLWNSRYETYTDDDDDDDDEYQPSPTLYHNNNSRINNKYYPRCVIVESSANLRSFDALHQRISSSSITSSSGYSQGGASSVSDTIPWGGKIQTSYHSSITANAAANDLSNEDKYKYHSCNGAKYWTDFLQPELHRKSIAELPTWTCSSDKFDSFHKGVLNNAMNDTITTEYIDAFMDQCRYFAEGCDHLSTIEVYTESTGGLSGLTSTLLQLIREEYGNSVCIPLWSITDHSCTYSASSGDHTGCSQMKSKLNVLDAPLFYDGTIEHSNVIIPISLNSILSSIYANDASGYGSSNSMYNKYISTAVASVAIEASRIYATKPVIDVETSSNATASHHSRGIHQKESSSGQHHSLVDVSSNLTFHNPHQWVEVITQNGRFPITFMEAGLPGILNRRNSKFDFNAYTTFERFLSDSFLSSATQGDDVQVQSTNPFSILLSPMIHNTLPTNQTYPYIKAFSNIVSVRGSSSEDLRRTLYSNTMQYTYTLTHCEVNARPMVLSKNSPLNNADENMVDIVTSIGASKLVGTYLESELGKWSEAYNNKAIAVQLNKAGLDAVECVEITERLHEYSQRYDDTPFNL